MIDINLLPPQNVLSVKEKSIRNQLTMIFVGVSILLVLVSGIIFAFKLFNDNQLSEKIKKRDQLLADFKSQGEIAIQLRTLKDKAAGIKIIQDTRTDFAIIATKLQEISNGTNLKNFSISSNGDIRFNASAKDLDSLDVFLKKISSDTDYSFNKSVLSGLRRESSGEFTYSVNTKYQFSKPK